MLNRLYSFFFNKANQVRSSFIRDEQEYPWRSRFLTLIYLFFLEFSTTFLKFLILVLPWHSYYETFQIFTNQKTLPVCQYSYFDHKKFQKKTRLISIAGASSIVAATIIINLVLSLILPGQLPSYAKTVNGPWDDWSLNYVTGDPASGYDGTANPAGSSIGALGISPSGTAEVSGTGTDSDVRLVSQAYSVTDDGTLTTTGSATGGTFSAGTNSNTVVSGTGSGASVGLGIDVGTGSDGALNLSSSAGTGCSGTGLSWASPVCIITSSASKSVWNFSSINIASGYTLSGSTASATFVTLKSQGAVTIGGIVDVNASGMSAGPGGYNGDTYVAYGNGLGPGGGVGHGGGSGGGGHGATGATGGGGAGGAGGSTYTTESGGSSGGMGGYGTSGAGGGYLKIISPSINNTGTITANGGDGPDWRSAGGGSGGRINLISYDIANTGIIRANGGRGSYTDGDSGQSGGGGGGGRIILQDSDGLISGGTITATGGVSGDSASSGGTPSPAYTQGTLTYISSATFTSAAINLGAASSFSTISWNATLNSQTITMKARSSANADMSGATAWGSCTNVTSGGSLSSGGCVTDGHQYIQYQATLSTTNTSVTPTLNSLTINYAQYPTSSTITNLKFNTTYSTVVWSQIALVTNAVSTSSIKVKARARVAANNAGLASASFVGYDGTTTSAGTYFDLFGSGQTNCSQADGKFGDTTASNATKKTITCVINQANATINVSANQWLELELVLVSDGSSTVQLDAARATYSVNNNPEVCAQLDSADTTNQTCNGAVTTLSVSQSLSDANYGHITFTTFMRDQDTADGNAAPGEDVLVGLEYSDASGNFSQSSPPSTSSYYDSGNFASNFTLTANDSGLSCTSTGYATAWKYLCTVNSSVNNGQNPLKFASFAFDWNVKQDLTRYSAAQKVRVIINDQEGINPVNISAPGTSSAFTVDTVNPTSSLTIDGTGKATASNQNISMSCSDDSTGIDSNYQFANPQADGTVGTWGGYTGNALRCNGIATSLQRTLTELSDRTTKLFYQFRDPYGNTTTSASVATGQRPINIALQDVSNVLASPASYKNFLSWEIVSTPANGFASYEVYRCDAPIGDTTCTNFTNYTRIASATPTGDRTVNYYTDSTPSAGATYYYRVATKDSSNHISAWSTSVNGIADGTQNGGEGGGGGDTTPPTVSNIQIPSGDITQTAATVTWTTNSSGGDNGGVFYSTNTSYGSEKSSLSYETSHSISLSGLSSGTNYNIRLKSTDASGNQTICDGTSAISTVTNANSTVTATNSATYCPSGATYTFTTATQDTTAPVISNISTSSTSVAASVVWTTDESSDTCVGYRRSDESSYPIEQCKSESVTSHSLTLSNLSPTTTYYLKIKSRDANNNTASSCYANSDNATVVNTDCSSETISDLSFTTTATISSGGGGGGGGGKNDFDAPRISDISTSGITSNSGTVIWKTNENSSSLISYGEEKDSLKDTAGQVDSVSDHKVVVKNLKPGTRYYFKITSVDWAGNIATTEVQEMTTKKDVASKEELGGTEDQKEKTQQVLEDLKQQIQAQGSDITDPLQALLESVSTLIPEPIIIGGAPEIEVNTTSATIKWRTDKNSSSFVALSRDDQYDANSDEPYKLIVGNPDDSVKEHNVNVLNLLPATKYHFQVRSKAFLGETSKSKNFTFTTKSELPQIINFLQKKTDDVKTATIYWETSIPTDSVVKYTPYVKGKIDPKFAKIQGKPDMIADHEIQITGLDPGTIYQVEISGRDPFGNQVSKVLPDFTTAIDKDAPVISQVRIESAMISGKTPKIQTIISWRTDEPATSQVFFSEGSGTSEQMKSVPLDEALSTTHTAVITEFKPASIYRIKIESKDEAMNLATSRDFTILTPAKSESIIDIIVKTFENTFGWVKNVKF